MDRHLSYEICPDLSAPELVSFLSGLIDESYLADSKWKVTVFRKTDDRGPDSISKIQVQEMPVEFVRELGIPQPRLEKYVRTKSGKLLPIGKNKAPLADRQRIQKIVQKLK